jgi:hypothetical protein
MVCHRGSGAHQCGAAVDDAGEWPTYTSRYLTLVTPAVVSLVLLFVWACRAGLVRLPDRWREQVVCVGGTLAFAGVLAGRSEGLVWMKLWRTQRLQSEALVAFTGALPMTQLQSVTHKYPPIRSFPPEQSFCRNTVLYRERRCFPMRSYLTCTFSGKSHALHAGRLHLRDDGPGRIIDRGWVR